MSRTSFLFDISAHLVYPGSADDRTVRPGQSNNKIFFHYTKIVIRFTMIVNNYTRIAYIKLICIMLFHCILHILCNRTRDGKPASLWLLL